AGPGPPRAVSALHRRDHARAERAVVRPAPTARRLTTALRRRSGRARSTWIPIGPERAARPRHGRRRACPRERTAADEIRPFATAPTSSASGRAAPDRRPPRRPADRARTRAHTRTPGRVRPARPHITWRRARARLLPSTTKEVSPYGSRHHPVGHDHVGAARPVAPPRRRAGRAPAHPRRRPPGVGPNLDRRQAAAVPLGGSAGARPPRDGPRGHDTVLGVVSDDYV